jgi:hypothetical protein
MEEQEVVKKGVEILFRELGPAEASRFINVSAAIWNNRVRITDHADEEAFDDALTFEEIYFFSVMHGEIIKDYPNDKPYAEDVVRTFEEIRNKLQKQDFSHLKTLGQSFTVEEDWPNKAIQPTA